MKSRLINFFMALVIFFTSINLQGIIAGAAENPVIQSDAIVAEAGTIISVPINISGNQGIMGFGINITYDKEVFKPLEVVADDLISNGMMDNSIETSKTNSFDVIWAGNEDMTKDGTLFIVSFQVAEEARGEYALGISYDQPDTFNESWEDVALECSEVTIAVTPPVIETVYLSGADNQIVDAGSSIKVPIKIGNNTDLQDVAMDILYDTSVFHLGEAENGLAGNMMISDIEGGIHLELTDIDALQADGDLVFLNFAVEDYVAGKYLFEILNQNIETLNFAISVNNTHSDEGTIIYRGAIITGEDNMIEIPVMIKNNTGIMGLKMTLTYDEKILTPVSVKAGELLKGNFDDNIGNKDGQYSVLWSGTENVYGNGEIFVATFQIASDVDVEDATIALSYSEPDTFNEQMEDVKLKCQDITFSLTSPEAKIDQKITTELAKNTIRVGETVNITVTAQTDKIKFNSKDMSIAEVDENGTVTGKKAGTVIIEIVAEGDEIYNSAMAQIEIVVTDANSENDNNPNPDNTQNSDNTQKPDNNVQNSNENKNPHTGNIFNTPNQKVAPPKKVTKVKVKVLSGRKLKITWKKMSQVSGYQIRYSTKKNMKSSKSVKVSGAGKNMRTLKKLKLGKNYFIQVRAYKKVNGMTYYGSWSKKVKKTVK